MTAFGNNRSQGYAAVFATVLIWSTPSLFQFYLLPYYEPFAQNFYRYSIAFLAILPLALYRFRRSGPPLSWGVIGICLLPAVPNVVHQVTQVASLHYMGPGVYAVFIRSSVIMTALLALVLFPEERWIIRQWQFQLGTLLGLIGAVGVFWFQPSFQAGPRVVSRARHRFHRQFLLGALRRLCEKTGGSLWHHPQFRRDQFSHLAHALPAHLRLRENRDAVSGQRGGKLDPGRVGGLLHHAWRTFFITSPSAKSGSRFRRRCNCSVR